MSTVLITGSSSGFGKATAQRFLESGWNVVATMRRPSDNTLEGPADRLKVVALDVADADSIKSAVRDAIGLFGGIDALVNNAGVGIFAPLETTTEEATRNLFEINTLGVIAMTRALIPHMRERRSGAIVNVTSSVVFNPKPFVSVYAATKAAVEGLSEALYHELAPFGIKVCVVEPGYGPDTKFGSRMMALNDERTFPAAYQAQLAAVMKGIPTNTTTLEDVADAVFRAVTDESATLQHPAGADSFEIAGRRAKLGQQAFIQLVRQSLS
ncbi:MAG: SDR family oxidoreductase [Pigmentiphaga sp.]|uniref:SDR family oxidoreductase n=1 Tax=Pigmentiphaga sp. TaxID=1977564 RepID=UPI0029A59FB0|nr:SDR family oxidoreductase [Pigmentiphaga sp.]MDX3905601.1 SDR family oxidoreductase [Pigmentiphaga sp.]